MPDDSDLRERLSRGDMGEPGRDCLSDSDMASLLGEGCMEPESSLP